MKLTVNSTLCSNFWVDYFLKFLKKSGQIDLTVNGSAQSALSLTEMNTLYILLPEINEQNTILQYVTRETGQIDTLIRETEEAIELLKEHRSALITSAVTGKICVKGEGI